MIGGILLAAGRSQRMGRPKLALPWKNDRPIIAHMVDLFRQAQIDPIVVVTGADRAAIEACLEDLPVTSAHNKDHASQGMIESVRVGLRALKKTACEAALISPADLPSLQPQTLRLLTGEFKDAEAKIVAPSYDGRRGHPVLISLSQWNDLLNLPEGMTLRDFLRSRSEDIRHLVVDDPGILLDLDTPGDFERARADSI